MDDHGHAEYIGDPIDPSDRALMAQAELAIGHCPEQALSWETAPVEY
jgi:ferredoxin